MSSRISYYGDEKPPAGECTCCLLLAAFVLLYLLAINL